MPRELKQDTLADICQKIRDAGIPDLADHIEAAWKRQMSQSWHHREMEELIAKHEKEVAELKKQTGNAAALRDAVIKALTLLNVCDWPPGVSLDGVGEVIREIDSVLDKPPRNCDVGTPKEQYKRYSAFTSRWTPCSFNGHARCAGDCPVNKKLERDGSGDLQCPFVWAQMPYAEEGGAK